jgi:DNA-binding NarL/FixJ family response regulator
MIRVLVATADPELRDRLRSAFTVTNDLRIVAEAVSGTEALVLTETLRPDVAFLEIEGLGTAGSEIRDRSPATNVILLLSEESTYPIGEGLRAGFAMMTTTAEAGDLIAAAGLALKGKAGVHPTFVKALIEETVRARRSEPLPAGGQATAKNFGKEQAADLPLFSESVIRILERIYENMGVEDRAAAVREAFRRSLLDD